MPWAATATSSIASWRRRSPIGDGANDVPMLRQAGFGIAYHGKPAAAQAAKARIRHGDLTVVLFALGIPANAFKH